MDRKIISTFVLAILVSIGMLVAVATSDADSLIPRNAQRGASVSAVTVATSNSDNLIPKGEEVFQKTAGNVGCQYCHGADAKGKVGPNIRGKSAKAITQALGTVLQMGFITLTEDQIEAVAAYLKYLESQP
ncbi:MAG: cytochrome c [Candidatus Tectomicrobia bacterium]|nr:cytochrome c [Candidatus Tectomicrobia bacterium]